MQRLIAELLLLPFQTFRVGMEVMAETLHELQKVGGQALGNTTGGSSPS